MAIVNKIIHRFVRQRDEYMDPMGELYNQIIPYNVQAYSYELKEGGDKNVPDDYIIRYVLGTGRSTYQQIADGLGKDEQGHLNPQLSKEFVLNSSTQLIQIITDLIEKQVIISSYITSDVEGNPFATKADLDAAEVWYDNGQSVLPRKNDYVIVTADETHPSGSGENPTARYVCGGIVNDRPVWEFQYVITSGTLTPEQEEAVNSGITTEKVEKYDSYEDQIASLLDHITDYNNPHRVTAEQIGLGNVDNTSDADKPLSLAAQEAIDDLNTALIEHKDNQEIHVTLGDKQNWNDKQDRLKMGNHIVINNNVINVEDDLAGYDNSVSQFVNKHTDELENYYTKDELGGVYKYKGEVETKADLPSGNVYAPDTYKELVYLTADQAEYIDTHYHPNQKTKIYIKFSANNTGNDYIYGTDVDHESNRVALSVNNSQNISKALFGNKQLTYAQDTETHTLIQKKSGVYLDDVQVGTYSNIPNFVTNSSLWLFRAPITDVHPLNVTIYEFQIYEDNDLLRHYIPVKREADGALGMYEVLSGEFKQNEYYPEEYEFIPGPVAGYGNQVGDTYKVLEDGKLYMWYDHGWISISQEIRVDGITIVKDPVDETLTAIGVKTKSDFIMYDWIGVKDDWEAGREAGTIPDDWICWITDDEEEPAGIANLAAVASTGDYNDLINKPISILPELPADKDERDYILKWDHLQQALVWESIS